MAEHDAVAAPEPIGETEPDEQSTAPAYCFLLMSGQRPD
jgi:hypothetical protein